MVGHHKLFERFVSMMAEGWSIGSSMFYGPPSVGKRTAAFEIAKGLLCLGKGFVKDCRCRSCLKFESDHPDFLCVGRTESIKVSDVDAILSFVSVAPFMSMKRIVVLDNAENMSVEASNRLLKIMEEPPANTHFFLVTSDPTRIIPTIVSRCVQFKFGRLSRMEITDVLWKRMGFDLPKATTLGWIANASLVDVFSNPGVYLKNRDMAVGLMQTFKAQDPLDALDFVDRVDKKEVAIFVDMLMMVIMDAINLKESGKEISNPDIRKEVEDIAQNFSGKALTVASSFIIQSKRGKKLNANTTMALKYALIKAHPLLAVREVS